MSSLKDKVFEQIDESLSGVRVTSEERCMLRGVAGDIANWISRDIKEITRAVEKQKGKKFSSGGYGHDYGEATHLG